MNRWNTTQQMANDIAKIDKSNNKELNIAQCNEIARNVKNLYKRDGKNFMLKNLRDTLSYEHAKNGFSMDQKDRAVEVVESLFKWHWVPFGRVRNNMARLCN